MDAFRLLTADMQMGKQLIQQHEENAAQSKAAANRQHYILPLCLRHLHGGDQQRPDGSRNHDARRKAQKYLLNRV